MTQPNIRAVALRAMTLAIAASALVPLARTYAADVSAPRLSKGDDYPHKSIRVIDPFPAAGAGDIMLAKSQPGKIGYGSSGVGGPVHIAGELFKSRAGINLLHVPYKGAAPIMTAVASGEVQIGLPSPAHCR
jgi:hypothetical protein